MIIDSGCYFWASTWIDNIFSLVYWYQFVFTNASNPFCLAKISNIFLWFPLLAQLCLSENKTKEGIEEGEERGEGRGEERGEGRGEEGRGEGKGNGRGGRTYKKCL
jgi:hypothetical protein